MTVFRGNGTWWCIGAAIAAILLIRTSIADTAWIPSASMNPTLVEGDLVYINRLAAAIDRCDVVVFKRPQTSERMVKRVIAGAGDTVEIANGLLLVNGKAVTHRLVSGDNSVSTYEESGLCDRSIAIQFRDELPRNRSMPAHRVAPDQVFVLGDARDDSVDSREFGDVPRASIVGRVDAVLVSFDTDHMLSPRASRLFAHLHQ